MSEAALAAALAGAKPPRVSTVRLVGPAAVSARGRITLPLGARLDADAATYAVALGPGDVTDVAAVARALPDPDTLPPGTLLLVLPSVVAGAPSLAGRFLAAVGRGPTASRMLRATALVARGYVGVAAGAGGDANGGKSDLVWGYAASERAE